MIEERAGVREAVEVNHGEVARGEREGGGVGAGKRSGTWVAIPHLKMIHKFLLIAPIVVLLASTVAAFQYLKSQQSAALVSPLSYTPREVFDEAPSDVLAATVQEEVPTPPISPSVSPSLTPKKSFTPTPTLTPTPTPTPTIDPKWEIIPGRGREEPVDPRAVKREKLGMLDWCVPNHVRYNSNLPLCTGPVDPVVQAFRDCVGKLQNYRPPDLPRDLWMEDITNRCIDEANI